MESQSSFDAYRMPDAMWCDSPGLADTGEM